MKLNWIYGALFAASFHDFRFGTDWGVHRRRTAGSSLRAAWATSRSGLRLGRRVLGPARAALSVGGGTLGPSAL